MKILIDNCLSEELVELAKSKGHEDSTHVRWLGKGDWKDWNLKPVIADGSHTFVTINSVDFRGPRQNKGSKGQHAEMDLHGGLICLNAPHGTDLDLQLELFAAALDELEREPDLINMALEVTLENRDDDHFQIDRYPIPKEGNYARDLKPARRAKSRKLTQG